MSLSVSSHTATGCNGRQAGGRDYGRQAALQVGGIAHAWQRWHSTSAFSS